MSDQYRHWGGVIRKLWPTERDKFRDHLLRLDTMGRRTRFAHTVSDRFIEDYAERVFDMGSIIFAAFDGGTIVATAELRRLSDRWGSDAEAAFSVETPHQRRGIGTALMGRVIRSARNRGIRHLYMSCLSENVPMQSIARRHGAALRFEYGEVVGELVPTDPNYFSLLGEEMDDRVGFALAVLDLHGRLIKAA